MMQRTMAMFALAMLVLPRMLCGQAADLRRVDSLIVAGDVPAAVAALTEEARRAPQAFEVLWRTSRVRVLQGDAAPERSRAQDRFYRQALDAAEQAIRAAPAAPEGYLRRAAAAGKVALFAGVLDASDFVLMAKADAERVIAMSTVDPALLGAAHYVLGRTHLKLIETPRPLRMPLGLGFGNLADAVQHLRQARALRPGFVMFELELARVLVADGKPEQARVILEALPRWPEIEPGDAQRKVEGVALLRTLR